MNIFFADISGKQAILNQEESWHCVKVLRKKAGDEVTVIDGKGHCGTGHISLANPKQCTVELSQVQQFEPNRPYKLHIAIAPTKNMDRMEWFVEKAVEIGVDEISLIQCKNSERTVVKTERLQKIIESAVKQSLQYYMPLLHELKPFSKILDQQADVKLMAHCEEAEKHHIGTQLGKNRSHIVLIGPEGDFTEAEITEAKQRGFVPISLGENRLRTETAGIYACSALAALLQN